jgi:hypothetical protein
MITLVELKEHERAHPWVMVVTQDTEETFDYRCVGYPSYGSVRFALLKPITCIMQLPCLEALNEEHQMLESVRKSIKL